MKKATKEQIAWVKGRIATDAEFAIKCLVSLVRRDDGSRDGIGLRNCDGRLASIAHQRMQKGWMSAKQAALVQRRLQCYARQLAERHIPAEWLEKEMAAEAGAVVATATTGRIESDSDIRGWSAIGWCE